MQHLVPLSTPTVPSRLPPRASFPPQRSLRSVRDEYDSTQQSLFELQSRMESLVGSRQQEAELAAEELERVGNSTVVVVPVVLLLLVVVQWII